MVASVPEAGNPCQSLLSACVPHWLGVDLGEGSPLDPVDLGEGSPDLTCFSLTSSFHSQRHIRIRS